MSVTRINKFIAAEGKAEELGEFLRSLVPTINSAAGCESCEVLHHLEKDEVFLVIEKWDSVDSHKQAVEAFPKEGIQQAMLLLNAPPKGQYFQA